MFTRKQFRAAGSAFLVLFAASFLLAPNALAGRRKPPAPPPAQEENGRVLVQVERASAYASFFRIEEDLDHYTSASIQVTREEVSRRETKNSEDLGDLVPPPSTGSPRVSLWVNIQDVSRNNKFDQTYTIINADLTLEDLTVTETATTLGLVVDTTLTEAKNVSVQRCAFRTTPEGWEGFFCDPVDPNGLSSPLVNFKWGLTNPSGYSGEILTHQFRDVKGNALHFRGSALEGNTTATGEFVGIKSADFISGFPPGGWASSTRFRVNYAKVTCFVLLPYPYYLGAIPLPPGCFVGKGVIAEAATTKHIHPPLPEEITEKMERRILRATGINFKLPRP